jgi:hypothetical protein
MMARLAKPGTGNIRHLYVFLMKFNVFTYAVNSVDRLRKRRSVSEGERADTLGPFRLSRLSFRLASFLPTRGSGVLFIPTKEKAPAALAALQRFPV